VGRTRSFKTSEAAPGDGALAPRWRPAARVRGSAAAKRRTRPRRGAPWRDESCTDVIELSPERASHALLLRTDVLPTSRPDLLSASMLGAIAGGVDAAGWFCLAGLLPSHLTASLVMLGARVAEYDAADVRARVAMLPVFVCTVASVKWSARWMSARKLPVLPILLSALTLGLGLFALAGALSDTLLADDPRHVLWIGGLGVASMAVQNAIMRLCLVQLCPTTVMTGNLTQLVMAGVDLLAHRDAEPSDARARLIRAGAPLLGFLFGSVTCGLVASRRGLICLLLPLAISAAVTTLAWRRARVASLRSLVLAQADRLDGWGVTRCAET
jgi:uncharacterized membrane protein YoaK (UPF0700 family)